MDKLTDGPGDKTCINTRLCSINDSNAANNIIATIKITVHKPDI